MTDPSPDTELATPLEAPRPRGGIAGLPWARISWIVASLLLLGYGVVLLRTAWISDDAFITFRVVDNLFRGHGLRWNPDERVWVNVHVLWIGFVSLLRALAGELYYSTIFASIGLSLLSVSLIVWRLAPSVLSAVPALALLLSSKAFVDFSTGGLENPLSTLILVAALISWFRLREGRRLWALAICMALGILTRPDSILLLGPLLLAAAWGRPWKTLLRVGLVAFGPMLLWLMIATVYFGTPVPNVAYAKAMMHGLPRSAVLAQALPYFETTLLEDPLTILGIVLGCVAALVGCGKRAMAPVLGVCLSLLYVAWIGGGFMRGRFLVAPFVVAVAMSASVSWRPMLGHALALGIVLFGLLIPRANLLSGADYDFAGFSESFVNDERSRYYQQLGLLSATREQAPQPGPEATPGQRRLVYMAAVGVDAFKAGPGVHVVDPLLCDPLLARLPAQDPDKWRPGHILRRIPEGYFQTLASGQNRIRDPQLAAYWDCIAQLTREPIWDAARLWLAVRMIFGGESELREQYVAERYRKPQTLVLDATELATVLPEGSPWYHEQARGVYEAGVSLRFAELQRSAQIELGLDSGDDYFVGFRQKEQLLGVLPVLTTRELGAGLRAYPVPVPAAAQRDGFDEIVVMPHTSVDFIYAVGWVRLR